MRLGELERAVMNQLWSRPQGVLARELAEALPSRPAITTVLTILERLDRKHMVRREREGRAHRYFALHTRDVHVAELMSEAFSGADDRESALNHFLESVSEEDVQALRRALAGKTGAPDRGAGPAGENGREEREGKP
ncbi:BlaI/MecI/CopY family transcriptional regulator [Spirillospora sp. CA-108201]